MCSCTYAACLPVNLPHGMHYTPKAAHSVYKEKIQENLYPMIWVLIFQMLKHNEELCAFAQYSDKDLGKESHKAA